MNHLLIAVISGSQVDECFYMYSKSSGSWVEVFKATASDGESGDRFGRTISLSGDAVTAISGARLDDDNGSNSGSAYFFQ